jgi:hypothetical protein
MKNSKNKQKGVKRSVRPKPEGRGVVFIALGSPQYGRLAANAAASIRFADKDIKIHLVHTAGSITHLTEQHKALFSSMEECPEEFMTKKGKQTFIKAKTCIYDLSPFEETIMMDVDLVMFGGRTISSLFDELTAQCDFTMQNRGFTDLSKEPLNESYCLWCNIKEVKEAYGLTDNRFYMLASEFVYFKRTEENKKFFDLVREIYDNPKVKGIKFDSDLPDELAYDIASAVLRKYPHQDNKVWIHWFAMEGKMVWQDIIKNYHGYSVGGNQMPGDVKMRYEQLTKAHAISLRLPYSYKLYAKKKWHSERIEL